MGFILSQDIIIIYLKVYILYNPPPLLPKLQSQSNNIGIHVSIGNGFPLLKFPFFIYHLYHLCRGSLCFISTLIGYLY